MDSLVIFDASSASREVQRLAELFVYLYNDLESGVREFCERWALDPDQPCAWASGLSSTMSSLNRDFRSTAIEGINRRIKLARTRSAAAIIKQNLPSAITFNVRQELSVRDVMGTLKSNYDNLPSSHRVSLKTQVWDLRQLSESYSRRTADLQSKSTRLEEWDHLLAMSERALTLHLDTLRTEAYRPRDLEPVLHTLTQMRNVRLFMLDDVQHASKHTVVRWTNDVPQKTWADTLSQVRAFYCTLHKQVGAQRELIDDITNVMLEAKCSSKAVNYPTGASYELCRLVHSVRTLEEVEGESTVLDKMRTSLIKDIRDVQMRFRRLHLS